MLKWKVKFKFRIYGGPEIEYNTTILLTINLYGL